MSNHVSALTNDRLIRSALVNNLEVEHCGNPEAKIIEELGIAHGAARIDVALVNGIIHGYELKSDRDTLARLPEQMRFYNSILDKVTLVVGKNHLYEAINLVPDWWGIVVAKFTLGRDSVEFCNIREAENNPVQNAVAVASLLWREEALSILELRGSAKGVRSKSKNAIYERLAAILGDDVLKKEVRKQISVRSNWRFEIQCTPSGD